MSAEIKTFPGIDRQRPPVVDEVVAVLRQMLAQAMRGELDAVLVAGVRPGGFTTYEFTGAAFIMHEMVAAVADAQFTLLAKRRELLNDYFPSPPDEPA